MRIAQYFCPSLPSDFTDQQNNREKADCTTLSMIPVMSGLGLQKKISYICGQVAMTQIKINKAKKCKAHYSNSSLPQQSE